MHAGRAFEGGYELRAGRNVCGDCGSVWYDAVATAAVSSVADALGPRSTRMSIRMDRARPGGRDLDGPLGRLGEGQVGYRLG